MIRVSSAVALIALAMSLAPVHAQTPQTPSLKDPASLKEQAPPAYKVRLETSKGPVVIQVNRAWAPNGADRFYNLVKNGFYDDTRFFRVVSGFMAQSGINPDPQLASSWRQAHIPDDPVTQSNKRGTITFATSGPNARTTQVFINFDDNSELDKAGFAPFGIVTNGMDVVDKLYAGYGDGPPYGPGPNQTLIQLQGNAYLDRLFPNLDSIKKATIEP